MRKQAWEGDTAEGGKWQYMGYMASDVKGGWEEGRERCVKGPEGHDKRYGFLFVGGCFYPKGWRAGRLGHKIRVEELGVQT